MSDILIRGMEMPKSCGECPFKKLSPTGESMICKLTLFTVPWNWKTTDCPLIHVPPHGDLIDRDRAKAISWTIDASEDFTNGVFYAIDWLNEMPTIIPAEEDD